ncbi:YfbU family protein [Nocardia tengchongensis]|uniref:YfbU family protein n=1 Tax=Nocardia tengchongensis TaxID=2055889 RepID=UPI0036899ADD
MATLTLRVDEETREELEVLARTKGTTVSVLLRDQIGQLLGRDVDMRRGDVPHSLTMTERLTLSQQAKILAALDPDEADNHLRRSEVLDEGYAGEYDDVFGAIGPELTRTECQLLWDVLDMFRVLGASINKLSQEDRDALGKDRADRLRFQGFDLNDGLEARLLSYTRYLTRTDRWEEIIPRLEEIGDDGNAHHRWLPLYQVMLEKFQPILAARQASRGYSRDALYFSLDELIEVAEVKLR